MLEGGQNDTAGVQFAHVPATLDSLRAMTDWFPMDTLKGLRSDFASAYRQDTVDLEQGRLCAAVTWSYSNQCIVFGSAATQLFLMANLEAWVPTYPQLSAVGPWHIHTVAATTIAQKASSPSKSQQQRRLHVVHGCNLHGPPVERFLIEK